MRKFGLPERCPIRLLLLVALNRQEIHRRILLHCRAQRQIHKSQSGASCAKASLLDAAEALALLETRELPTQHLLEETSLLRHHYFGSCVQLHIINNVRNGHCPEDCSYCAQRSKAPALGQGPAAIPAYTDKSTQEILAEAKSAWEKGAYRYCIVSAGRSPNKKSIERYAFLIKEIKKRYPLEVCLSLGLLHDSEDAKVLAQAGLDRYNHNLNSSPLFYPEICQSHKYEDRLHTLRTLAAAGIGICSGVIAGLGESSQDLVDVAFALQKQRAASIPVNFFLPVPGHGVKKKAKLSHDYCLRLLCVFRLLNPEAELRLAAGREYYLASRQKDALAVANSLFVSGYLNAHGSSLSQSIALIKEANCTIAGAGKHGASAGRLQSAQSPVPAESQKQVSMKSMAELRPFQRVT